MKQILIIVLLLASQLGLASEVNSFAKSELRERNSDGWIPLVLSFPSENDLPEITIKAGGAWPRFLSGKFFREKRTTAVILKTEFQFDYWIYTLQDDGKWNEPLKLGFFLPDSGLQLGSGMENEDPYKPVFKFEDTNKIIVTFEESDFITKRRQKDINENNDTFLRETKLWIPPSVTVELFEGEPYLKYNGIPYLPGDSMQKHFKWSDPQRRRKGTYKTTKGTILIDPSF